MNKHVRWLHEQLPAWVTQGLITPAQAEALRRLHPEPKAGLPWGMLIFSGIGAVVIGLGIILLLAYNWQAIPKFAKLGLIFGALIAAHAGGLRCLKAGDWRRQLGEALGVLGTMLFGAGIWLIAQVYHIDEHYPNGFLLWGMGALVLAWALPSISQGVLAVAALTVWGATEGLDFHDAVHWAPLLLVAGVGGLAWKERSRLLLAVTLAGFYFLLLTNAAGCRGSLAFPAAMNVSVLLVGLGVLAHRAPRFSESAGILRFFGWLGFLAAAYLLSFHDVAEDALEWHAHLMKEKLWMPLVVYGWLPFALVLATWTWAALRLRTRPTDVPAPLAEQWLLPLAAVLSQVLAVGLPLSGGGMINSVELAAAGIFNLIFLAVAGTWMAKGCREGELRPVILGSLLLIALVVARYFDLFDSLAWRGLAFVVTGGVLFAEGFFYRRARQQSEEGRTQP